MYSSGNENMDSGMMILQLQVWYCGKERLLSQLEMNVFAHDHMIFSYKDMLCLFGLSGCVQLYLELTVLVNGEISWFEILQKLIWKG